MEIIHYSRWPFRPEIFNMRALRLALFIVSALASFAPALAQPDGYVTGSYRLAMTIDGVRYKLSIGGYQLSTTVIRGDTVPILNIWLTAADLKRSSLPGATALKGKQASKTTIFKETSPGKFQRIALDNVGIQSFSDGSEVLGSTGVLVVNPDHHILEIRSPRDVASGQATGSRRTLPFTGRSLELGGNDWE